MLPVAAIVLMVWLASGCGNDGSPAAPSPLESVPAAGPALPTTLPGVWHAYVKGTECLSEHLCYTGRTVPFILRTLAAGDGYTGTLEVPVETGSGMSLVMNVAGRPDADGVVIFSGSRGPIDTDRYHVELFRLAVRIDPASGLTGDIDLQKFPTPNLSKRTLQGQVVSASYQPWSPPGSQPATGTWRGRAIIRGCEGFCPIYQDVGDEIRLTIVLGQQGDTVSGRMQPQVNGCVTCWLPVAGTAAGSSIALSSQPVALEAGRQLHVEHFEATVDDLARLAGRFVIAVNNRIAIAPYDVFSRLELEFLWLQRD